MSGQEFEAHIINLTTPKSDLLHEKPCVSRLLAGEICIHLKYNRTRKLDNCQEDFINIYNDLP
mgnify:FL=1